MASDPEQSATLVVNVKALPDGTYDAHMHMVWAPTVDAASPLLLAVWTSIAAVANEHLRVLATLPPQEVPTDAPLTKH